ncbi:MAG: hypothetical protein Q4C47_01900, partial [Planctomycetia bacterium]|nr:hypothetical protein [Planctomycetia bacterium]
MEREPGDNARISGGPVYSEGNNHWYYVGLTDGNYGQDQAYAGRIPNGAWIVDFDLMKMHPLGTSFGMGNPGMFYGDGVWNGLRGEERVKAIDRFLAATIAFGHTGFFVTESLPFAARSYFMLQQLQKRYASQPVHSIRYMDEHGTWLDTSFAIQSRAHQRNQLRIEYEDGLTIFVNGNPTEKMSVEYEGIERELPPNGWDARDPSQILVAAYHTAQGDYVESPAYLYADGRGKLRRFTSGNSPEEERLVCDGQLIVIPRSTTWRHAAERAPRVETESVNLRTTDLLEVIPIGCGTIGVTTFGRTVASVEALAEDGSVIGPAEYRFSQRGLVYMIPVEGVASYLVTLGERSPDGYHCEKRYAIAGETVTFRPDSGTDRSDPVLRTIPEETTVDTVCFVNIAGTPDGPEEVWDFVVIPFAEITTTLEGNPLTEYDPELKITAKNKDQDADAWRLLVTLVPTDEAGSTEKTGDTEEETPAPVILYESTVDPHETASVSVPEEYRVPGKAYRLEVTARPVDETSPMKTVKRYTLRTENRSVEIGPWDWNAIVDRRQQFRNGQMKPIESHDGDTGATADLTTRTCGGVSEKCLFTHPPYLGGTGAVSVTFRPTALPSGIPMILKGLA